MAKKYTDASAYPMYMDVQTNAPLDNRTVVENIADLTNGTITYPYLGLTVYVLEDKNVYVCTKYNPLSNPTTAWKIVGDEKQVDWEENDPNQLSYIKNKPEVYTKDEVDEIEGNIIGRLKDTDANLSDQISELEKDAEKANEELTTQLTTYKEETDATLLIIKDRIGEVQDLIPSQASEENQLADKAFVNSSIATNTAEYISNNGLPFSSVADLQAYTGPHDNNDYAFVKTLDALGNEVYYRYKYSGATNQWNLEYQLNNSSFTQAQWDAINSMITSGLVAKLQALPTVAELVEAFGDKQNKLTFDQQPTEGSVNPVTSGGISNAINTSHMRWGVTSQKQNWTKAADGGYDYTMSNIVYGYIPQANIDLFEEAGAVFNEESGYFELNDLTDISYKEMIAIYREASHFSLYISGDSYLGGDAPRTLIYKVTSGVIVITNYFRWFSHSETHGSKKGTVKANNNIISYAFYNQILCLRKILFIIVAGENTAFSRTCFQCPSLEYVKIKNLNHDIYFIVCARLNYESIKYLIDNATDSEKTVTVHPTTYDYLIGAAEPTARVGGTSEEWQQLVADAAEKNISFATE